MSKASHTLDSCSLQAKLLSTRKENRNETFHVIKTNKHFIVSDNKNAQKQFISKNYWVVRKSYYVQFQGSIVVSFRNGIKTVNNSKNESANPGTQTQAEFPPQK